MVSVWSNDENKIILNVGDLLLFWKCMIWVSCNINDVTVGPRLKLTTGCLIWGCNTSKYKQLIGSSSIL